jgi:hypothetical protein
MTTWGLALGMAETACCGITTWGIRDDSGRRKLILKGNSNFPGQRPGLPPLLGARQRDQHRLHPLRGAIKGREIYPKPLKALLGKRVQAGRRLLDAKLFNIWVVGTPSWI